MQRFGRSRWLGLKLIGCNGCSLEFRVGGWFSRVILFQCYPPKNEHGSPKSLVLMGSMWVSNQSWGNSGLTKSQDDVLKT